jgi:hypothetical protein
MREVGSSAKRYKKMKPVEVESYILVVYSSRINTNRVSSSI